MSNVFIPLGGAGGKTRGNSFYISDAAPTTEILGRIITPLPAGVYKKFVTPDGQVVFPSADGGDAIVSMSKEFLKKQAIKTFGIASITNFSLSMYAHRQVRLTWAKPDRGLWSGTRFVFKYGSMPTSETDGFMVYDSADVHYETTRLEERELFIRAFNYVTVRDGRWYDEGTVSAKITVTGISGSVTLSTGAGTWTVPDGVRRIRYILVGHGGNGALSERGGGGGGGGYFNTGYMTVTPGQNLTWIVPSAQGQATSLDGVIANSGKSPEKLLSPYRTNPYKFKDEPQYHSYSRGGSGGSGGGGGSMFYYGSTMHFGGGGGANGSMGYGAVAYKSVYAPDLQLARGGDGQGVSTRGFNNVLYSGGGGGFSYTADAASQIGSTEKPITSFPKLQEPHKIGSIYRFVNAGVGGDGGGGHGQNAKIGLSETATNATSGVDGLGGGGGGAALYIKNSKAGQGGTGCIYIAWGSLMNDGT